MIVARFPDGAALDHAAAALRRRGLHVHTRTPIALPEDEHAPSRIPRLVLAAALLSFAAAFGMQCYANMVSYPQLIGGRPAFLWTAYLVWAVEAGVLAAITAATASFFVANRLPRYWEPSDESAMLHDATRDGWFLLLDNPAPEPDLSALGATRVERLPA